MPKSLTRKQRWKHPLYTFACCYPRQGIVYTEINFKGNTFRKSTGLKWNIINKEPALKLLETSIKKMLEPDDVVEKNNILTVYELVKHFKLLHVDKLSRTAKRRFEQANYHFLKHDFYLKDVEGIRLHIMNNIKKSTLHVNNIYKLLSNLMQMFHFGVEQDYIVKNPLIKSMFPRQVKTNMVVFTNEELNRIVEYLTENKKIKVAGLVRFIAMTGVRINEAINIKISDVSDDYIIIHGKGDRPREFPLIPFPELKVLIEEIKLAEGPKATKLFPWKSYAGLERTLRDTLEKLNINKSASFHSIRKFRENQLINEQDLDPYITAELLGHTVRIQEKHYKEVLGAKRMTEIIMRRRNSIQ